MKQIKTGSDENVLPQNAEAKLRRAERRIKNILESFSDAFFTVDGDWRFIYVNRHAEQILGRTSAELLGKNMWEEFPESVETEIYDYYHKAVKEQTATEFEIFYPPFDAWFEARLYPSPDGGLAVYFHNINERKLAADVLRESEERYRTLFNSIDEGFCVIQMMFDGNEKPIDYHFLEINPAFEKLTGISADEALLGKPISELVPNFEKKWFEIYGRIALTGEAQRFVEGSEAMSRWFDVYAFRTGQPEDRKVAILFNNITDRKFAEENLRENRERLNFALEAAEIGDWDLDLTTGDATRSFLHDKCFGATDEPFDEWSYEKFLSFVHPNDKAEVDEKFGRALKESKEWSFECRVIWADKSVHWIEGHGSVYRTTDGKPARMLGIVADITERKRAELNLKFLAEISQDLARLNEVEEILETMVAKIGVYFGVENCVFAEIDTTANTASINPLWRVDEQAVDFSGDYQLSDFVSDEFRQTLMADKPVIVNDVENDSRTFENAANFRHLKIGSFANAPYVSGGELKFILGVYRFEAYEWRADEIELLGELMTRIWTRIERARAEIKLRESEQHLAAMINQTISGIAETDLTGHFIFVNDRFCEITGYSREALLGGLRMHDITHPDDLPGNAEQFQLLAEQGIAFTVEKRYIRKDNSIIWVKNSVSATVDADGEQKSIVAVMVDITRNKIAEQSLRESEEKFRQMADHAPVMVWVTDASGYCHFLSQSWYEFTGQTPETGFGFGWVGAVHPDDRQKAEETFISANEKHAPFEIEYRLRRYDGEYLWAIDSAQPRFSNTGEYLGYIGSVVDIHERKQMENQLRESEQRLRALADSIPQLAWMAEPDGAIFWYNQRWYEYTGTTAEDMTGWGWQSVHDEKILPEVLNRWQASIQTGAPFEMEFPLRRGADSAFRWFLTRVIPIRDSNGNIVRWFGTNTDIEDFRQVRLQAEQANSLKDEFLATLSHELRTPLNAILGWSKMLQTNSLGEEATKKAIDTIERSARSQNQLIEDLLDVSRIITGKLRLDVQAIDLPNVITSAVDAARPAAEAKNIRLQTLLDPQAGPISGDPDRIQQIVWNLLSNAVKFTPKNGRIQIRLERINSHIEIVVSDTGKGIEPEFLPHVFNRFSQSDGSMTRRHGGLGLGLAIVRQLVELHGGTVSVESDGQEQGTTFTVSLPLLPVRRESTNDEERRVHPKASADGAGFDCPPELDEIRILLVEDEADSRDLVNLVLEECGAKVETADSAAEALEAVRREKFHIIISDIGMPEEDGFSLIGKIRQLNEEQNGKTPAIALTAYARAEDRVRALRSGFQMHIAKPVEPAELIAVVANLAGRIKNQENNGNG